MSLSRMDLCKMMIRELEERVRREQEEEKSECPHPSIGEDEHMLLCYDCGEVFEGKRRQMYFKAKKEGVIEAAKKAAEEAKRAKKETMKAARKKKKVSG